MKLSKVAILSAVIGALFSCHMSQAQSLFSKWTPGKVTMADGQTFEADLFYKLKSEELEVKINKEVKAYKAKDVTTFEMKDGDSVEVYISLPFDLYEENSPVVFFQLLKELNDFYLLAKQEPEVANTYSNSISGTTMSSYQPEMLFFLTKEGKVEIYSSSNPGVMKMTVLKGSKRYVNIDLLRRLTDPYFDKLQEYAEQNYLSFGKKKDLLEILNYYESL